MVDVIKSGDGGDDSLASAPPTLHRSLSEPTAELAQGGNSSSYSALSKNSFGSGPRSVTVGVRATERLT